MAMSGLFVSSLCLVLVHGVLSGLQGNRISKSKEVEGHFYSNIAKDMNSSLSDLQSFLDEKSISYALELEVEGLLKNENTIIPVILHGVAKSQIEFVDKYKLNQDIIFSAFIAHKLKVRPGSEIQFISPAHSDSFFGDLPRYKTVTVVDIIDSKDPEIDEFHAWTNVRVLQSLVRSKIYNKIRFFSPLSNAHKKEIEEKFKLNLISWEENHQGLVYALSMENNIILFLFSATVILVGLCIVSGLSIFYNRLKQDFVSFWILGMSISDIRKKGITNISIITILTLILGNLFGVIVAFILKRFSPVIMPEMFVERSLPVNLSISTFVYSLFFPFVISIFFSYFSGKRMINDDTDFLKWVRSVGN